LSEKKGPLNEGPFLCNAWCWLQDLNPPPPDYKSGLDFIKNKYLDHFLLRNPQEYLAREAALRLARFRIAERNFEFLGHEHKNMCRKQAGGSRGKA